MKHLFLRGIKVENNITIKESKTDTMLEKNSTSEESAFEDDFYEEYRDSDTDTELYGFKRYNISTDCIVSLKEARTAIEEKKPFIISKIGKRHAAVEERDTIYRTSSKLKISNSSVERVGFILADNKYKEIKLRKNKKKYKGILNDCFMICKKKPLNYKKVGYLELQSMDSNKYVEVVTNRGYKWFVMLMVILALIAMLLHKEDWSSWKFNVPNLKIYKTKEITEYKANELSISFNASPVLRDGKINLNLSSEYQDNMIYDLKIYDENKNLMYENNGLNAGDGISSIELLEKPAIGEYNCKILCDYYLSGVYSGTLESDFVLQVN